MQDITKSFYLAKEREQHRKQFINSLNLRQLELEKYVKSLEYVPLNHYNSDYEGFSVMTTRRSILSTYLSVPHTRSRIIIYPIAFETSQNIDDFLSVLIDHEGQHAKDRYEEPELDDIISEIKAIKNQMTQIKNGKRSVSQSYKDKFFISSLIWALKAEKYDDRLNEIGLTERLAYNLL